MRSYIRMQSLIGELYIVAEDSKITAVHLGEDDFLAAGEPDTFIHCPEDPVLTEAVRQLKEYFSGERRVFDLPLKEEGTFFQTEVWKELAAIPYGETRSYQEVAIAIGREKAVRAIGQANKANKLPIIVPCHRVIGKNKSLTGYAGKRIHIKEQLLSLEGSSFQTN